jgi:hypothetical protein
LAIFHLSAHDRVSRSAGQTSVASAAYIFLAKVTDERTGQGYDFRYYSGAPEWAGMFSPKGAPEWTHDAANAEKFWNALELFETRKDAQVALLLDIAMPRSGPGGSRLASGIRPVCQRMVSLWLMSGFRPTRNRARPHPAG